jgi:hypothetical protein
VKYKKQDVQKMKRCFLNSINMFIFQLDTLLSSLVSPLQTKGENRRSGSRVLRQIKEDLMKKLTLLPVVLMTCWFTACSDMGGNPAFSPLKDGPGVTNNTSTDPQASDQSPSGVTGQNNDETPAAAPVPSAARATPETPPSSSIATPTTPPASAKAGAPGGAPAIEDAHAKYAAAIGIPLDKVEAAWNNRLRSATPDQVSGNRELIDAFLGFVFDSDAKVQQDVKIAWYFSEAAQVGLSGNPNDLPLFENSVLNLSDPCKEIQGHLLNAAQIYDIDLKAISDRSLEGSLGADALVSTTFAAFKKIRSNNTPLTLDQTKEWSKVESNLRELFHDLAFSTLVSGNPVYVSDFTFQPNPKLTYASIFTFNDNGKNYGVFGLVDSMSISFIE